MNTTRLNFLAIAFIFFFGGCGQQLSPSMVTEQFLSLVSQARFENSDYKFKKAEDFISSDLSSVVVIVLRKQSKYSLYTLFFGTEENATFTILGETIDGNSSQVLFNIITKDSTLKFKMILIKEYGDWKICGAYPADSIRNLIFPSQNEPKASDRPWVKESTGIKKKRKKPTEQ